MRRVMHAIAIVVLAAAVWTCWGCGEGGRLKKFHEEKVLLGSFVQVDVCAPVNEAAAVKESFHDLWNRLGQIDQRMNVYDPSSEVARINASAGKPVAVHPDVRGVIWQAVEFSRRTEGMFDITVRPLIVLWKEAAETRQLPDEAALKNALQSVGFDKIIFNRQDEVQLKGAAQLDLSGIGQGYAADEAARILRSAGWNNFLIDVGGDMFAGGLNCSGRPWRIGIQHPRKDGRLIDIVELSNQGVVTSGDYEKFYEINGKKWSHIINPLTGYPQQGVVSATVIAPTALEADVFSTTLCILPPAKGIDFVERLGESYAAFLIEDDPAAGLKFYPSQRYLTKSSGIYNKDAK